MSGEGPLAEQIRTLFEVSKRRAGLTGRAMAVDQPISELSSAAFRVPTAQLDLF
jgi:hypothetical protein